MEPLEHLSGARAGVELAHGRWRAQGYGGPQPPAQVGAARLARVTSSATDPSTLCARGEDPPPQQARGHQRGAIGSAVCASERALVPRPRLRPLLPLSLPLPLLGLSRPGRRESRLPGAGPARTGARLRALWRRGLENGAPRPLHRVFPARMRKWAMDGVFTEPGGLTVGARRCNSRAASSGDCERLLWSAFATPRGN